MPPTYQTNELFTLNQSNAAGLAGGAQQIRGSDFRGKLHIRHFTLTNSTVVATSPTQNGVALAIADILILSLLDITDKIFFGRIYFSAWGAGCTLSIGKIDPNLSSNTDAVHYKALTSVAAAGNFDLDTNIGEQVGTDPAGDQTSGNLAPNFGSQKIQLTATVAGGTPAINASLNGYVLVTYGD